MNDADFADLLRDHPLAWLVEAMRENAVDAVMSPGEAEDGTPFFTMTVIGRYASRAEVVCEALAAQIVAEREAAG